MKKLYTHCAILIVITAYFIFNGFIPRKEEITVYYGCLTFTDCEIYSKFLQSEGYSKLASNKIAKVEFGLLPVDEDYTGLKED